MRIVYENADFYPHIRTESVQSCGGLHYTGFIPKRGVSQNIKYTIENIYGSMFTCINSTLANIRLQLFESTFHIS